MTFWEWLNKNPGWFAVYLGIIAVLIGAVMGVIKL